MSNHAVTRIAGPNPSLRYDAAMAGRILRLGSWLVASSLAALALAAAIPLVDMVLHTDQVHRNTTIEGRPIGGLGAADLDAVLGRLAAEAAATSLRLDGGGHAIEATAGDLGVSFDAEAVAGGAMAVGRGGPWVDRIGSWWRSLWSARSVATVFTIDEAATEAFLAEHPASHVSDPVEPSFTGRSGRIVVTPGRDGLALDPAAAAAAVASEIGTGRPPERVAISWQPVPPLVDERAVTSGVAEANRLARDLRAMVNGRAATVPASWVVGWIESRQEADSLVPEFDPMRTQAAVEARLAPLTDPGTRPTFAIEDGEVVFELGEEPMRCCAPGVAPLLYDVAMSGRDLIAVLPAVAVYDDGGLAAAEAIGIGQVVGSFTTNHACCESRVTNIHRIADLVRGVLIMPGERFSVNDYVGLRTRENGFVTAGIIAQGHFTEGVGGGVSQFATTLFNAAYFAGLDLVDYQSHSIYISRYPYGREATLSYPLPDLVIENTTPYGMLIWTGYDDASITVELWSTPYFDVAEGEQRRFRWGACTRVETDRLRTDPAGILVEDTVYATYRPSEGRDCNGNLTPQP